MKRVVLTSEDSGSAQHQAGLNAVANGSNKIHALTSLRFFAALFVVLYHVATTPNLFGTPWFPRLIWLGYTSVSFFFLLSGYILAIVYLGGGRRVNIRRFALARFARIYPLFVVTLVMDTPHLLMSRVVASGWEAAIAKTAATFAADLFMLQAWSSKFHGIDGPNWSLSVEAFFYLCFPLLGPLLWRLRGAGFWLSLVSLYVGGQALVLLCVHVFPQIDAKDNPILHLSTFALGILLASWQSQYAGSTGRPGRKTMRGVAAGASIVAGLIVWFSQDLPQVNLNDGLLAPVFAAYIWVFAQADLPLSQMLGARWLVLLGEASFALYLVHAPVLHLLLALHATRSWWMEPLFLTACIGLSLGSYLYFEVPSRRWLLTRFHTRVAETREQASLAQ